MSVLDRLMEFDHVVRVAGVADDADIPSNLHAPEVVIETDDGQILKSHEDDLRDRLREQGWDIMDGYSGQYSYRGPIMHSSESIGGRLANDILAKDGYYVAVVVNTDDGDVAGWMVLRCDLDREVLS